MSDHLRRGTEHHFAKLDEAQVREIRREAAEGKSRRKIAKERGMSFGHVSDIVSRKLWSHVQ